MSIIQYIQCCVFITKHVQYQENKTPEWEVRVRTREGLLDLSGIEIRDAKNGSPLLGGFLVLVSTILLYFIFVHYCVS